MTALRIGIDVREWRAGTSTGIGRVLAGFIAWAAAHTEHELLLLGNQRSEQRVDGARISMRVVPEGSRLLWDQFLLPRALASCRADVFYSPYYKGPLRAPCPAVVTANDLIELRFPRGTALRRRLLPWWMRLLLGRAAHVMTLSEHSRRDLIELLGIPAHRISAFPLAVDQRFRQPVEDHRIERVRARYGLPGRYALYVGRCAPHKNVGVLLRAWRRLQSAASGCPLVLAGGDDERFHAAALDAGVDVAVTGFVPDDDLPALYAGATLMCFPSLYEGFGLPPLEAMACGTPVLAANASSIPEVLGDAARLLDPMDERAWAATVQELLDNEQERARLAAAGRARASTYTPERSAETLLRCLIEAAGSGGST